MKTCCARFAGSEGALPLRQLAAPGTLQLQCRESLGFERGSTGEIITTALSQ